MNDNTDAYLLRIFIGSSDMPDQQLLYEKLVFQAKNAGMAGVTVTKGIMSFGASSVIHSYKFWEVTDKVPVIVELIDEEQKIRSFLDLIRPTLESMKYGCLVTLDRTQVVMYKTGKKRAN
ncbi:MAG TPA: DUF190 domain-containing protein [Prolixibacteraceae bacterium]|nr:DUF190 domain-containing protein [Prolixibacteraceae bacterium]